MKHRTLAAVALVFVTGLLLGGLVSGFLHPYPAYFEGALGKSPPTTFLIARGAKSAASPPSGIRMPGQPSSEVAGQEMGELPTRMVVYTGYAKIEVEERGVKRAVDELRSIAEDLGGYVASSKVREDSAYVVIRVPSDRFSEAVSRLKNLGKVVELSTSSQDVTEQYIDLQARLRNAKAEEERLLKILGMAKSVQDVLMVERELKNIREYIERLEAQIKYIERRVEYSTLSVYVYEKKKPEYNLPEFNIMPAVMSGVAAMYDVIYAIVYFLIAASPLLIIGAIGYAGYRALRGHSPIQAVFKRGRGGRERGQG